MSSTQLLAVAIFPILGGISASGTLLTSRLNGTLDLLGVTSILDPRLFARFFTPILDRANVALNLQGVHFLGGWMSAWILILMDSFREPPAAHNLSRKAVALLGVLMELTGVANMMPVWAGLSIYQSYAQPQPLGAISSANADALPWALVAGTLIPTLLMRFLPAEDAPGLLLSKSTWIYIRLFHPVLTMAAHRLFKTLRSEQVPLHSSSSSSSSSSRTKRLYDIAFWTGALPHMLTMGVMAAVQVFPRAFSGRIAAMLAPQMVWPLAAPWPAHITKAQTAQAGIGMFLVWDELIASATILAWALIVNGQTRGSSGAASPVRTLGKAIVQTVLFGPSAAAVSLIRDNEGKK
jgi:hypothetical protein